MFADTNNSFLHCYQVILLLNYFIWFNHEKIVAFLHTGSINIMYIIFYQKTSKGPGLLSRITKTRGLVGEGKVFAIHNKFGRGEVIVHGEGMI